MTERNRLITPDNTIRKLEETFAVLCQVIEKYGERREASSEEDSALEEPHVFYILNGLIGDNWFSGVMDDIDSTTGEPRFVSIDVFRRGEGEEGEWLKTVYSFSLRRSKGDGESEKWAIEAVSFTGDDEEYHSFEAFTGNDQKPDSDWPDWVDLYISRVMWDTLINYG